MPRHAPLHLPISVCFLTREFPWPSVPRVTNPVKAALQTPKTSAHCFRPGAAGTRATESRATRKYVKNVRGHEPDPATLHGRAIDERAVALALGPAGTGKTYLAIAKAVEALEAGRASRIVLTRPAVEAGREPGFLPATCRTSWRPYLRPPTTRSPSGSASKRLKAWVAEGVIEIARR